MGSKGKTMSRYEKIIHRLAMVGAAFTGCCYLVYFLKQLIVGEGVLPMVLTIAVLLFVFLPVLWDRFGMRNKPHTKGYCFLKTVYAAVTLFYTITFLWMCVGIYSMSSHVPAPEEMPQKTVYVVFGCKTNGMNPGRTLRYRLDKAVDQLTKDPDSLCVVTGGQGNDEQYPEAEVMKHYLISCGIEESRIFTEPQASNTKENIAFTQALLKEKGMEDFYVVCISSTFHLPRIRYLCEESGFSQTFVGAHDGRITNLFPSLVREYMSYVRLILGV